MEGGICMADFWQDLFDIPEEKALHIKGGLKIGFSRKELQDYFNILLDIRPLERLVGETACWVLIPSTLAIYSFPIMFWITKSLFLTCVGSFGFMMSFSLLNQSAYNYFINRYLVRFFAHIIPKVIFLIAAAIMLYQSNHNLFIAFFPFLWYLFIDRIPILYLLSELMLAKTKTWMYNLPDSDGVLRQVGWYWARKYRLTQSKSGKVTG